MLRMLIKKIVNPQSIIFLFFCILSFLFVFYGPMLFWKLDQNAIIGRSLHEDIQLINKDYDVLLIGDSRCHQGCDPNQIKKHLPDTKVYNLGRPAMQLPFVYFVLADYLDSCQKKPKVIVLNVSFYLLGGHRGYMEDIYLTHYKPKMWQVYKAVLDGLITPTEGFQWYFIARFPPIKYRKSIRSVLDSIAKGKIQSVFCNIPFYQSQFSGSHYGYYSRFDIFNPFNASPYAYKKGTYEDKLYLRYLHDIFYLAEKHGIKLVIYSFPWPKQLETDEMKDILSYYDSIFKKTATPFKSVEIIDEHNFWDSKYFGDQQHLNDSGANILAKKIATWVEKYL